MTDLELNIALHEKLMGKCWHDFSEISVDDGHSIVYDEYLCVKCKLSSRTNSNPSYTTNPTDYWELLQEVKKDEGKWDAFISDLAVSQYQLKGYVCSEIVKNILLDMPRGCQAIWEFFCKEK